MVSQKVYYKRSQHFYERESIEIFFITSFFFDTYLDNYLKKYELDRHQIWVAHLVTELVVVKNRLQKLPSVFEINSKKSARMSLRKRDENKIYTLQTCIKLPVLLTT